MQRHPAAPRRRLGEADAHLAAGLQPRPCGPAPSLAGSVTRARRSPPMVTSSEFGGAAAKSLADGDLPTRKVGILRALISL